jgi:hypothetical protein
MRCHYDDSSTLIRFFVFHLGIMAGPVCGVPAGRPECQLAYPDGGSPSHHVAFS